MKIQNITPINLNSLPIYSPWVPKLLSLETISHSLEKTSENVFREYDKDKWGVLLKNLKKLHRPTIGVADSLSYGPDNQVPFYAEENLYLAKISTMQKLHFKFIRDETKQTLLKTKHIVELGAGYGTQLLKLAMLPEFKNLKFTAAEYTDSGIDCINLLARDLNLRLETGHCDLNNLCLNAFDISEKAVFMTCWTMACVKGFSRNTLLELIRHKPLEVVHIEPIFEHWNADLLLHMLWKRYSQINDYNQSMLTGLKEYEKEGLIEIIEERPNLFGINPLFPASVIKWRPCNV